MEIYRNNFFKLDFLEDTKIMVFTWFPTTSTMEDEDVKAAFNKFLELALVHKPIGTIPDTTEMYFPIMPELQEWINYNIFPPLLAKNISTRVAFVVNHDIIINLSTEQIMEEVNGVKFVTHYFEDKEQAIEWIRQEIALPN